jgi:hypothetical protein
MSIVCEFCDKTFTTKGNLVKHQKSAKYCIEIRLKKGENIDEIKEFKCNYCDKKFTDKNNVTKHQMNCNYKFIQEIEELNNKIIGKDNKITELESENNILQENIKIYDIENKLLREQINKDNPHKYIIELQDKLHEIAKTSIEQKNEVITNMVKKYIKKQPRKQFDCRNVVYILTTPSLQKDRRFIIGKAKNLTSRLSTYNKTDEHEVIFYQECDQEDTMDILERLVLKKLDKYKEQANRERFILPNDKNIDYFIEIIKNSLEFLD